MQSFDHPISAVIVCFNEVGYLGACIDSVAFCKEIVIVDSGSVDGTLELLAGYQARGYPIQLYHHAWQGYAQQKQYALDRATQPLCFVIDADERADLELSRSLIEISGAADSDNFSAWRVRRRDWLPNYGLAHPWVAHNRIQRLFRRGRASYDPNSTIHETVQVVGATGDIRIGLLNHVRRQTLAEEVARANAYSTQKSEVRMAEGNGASIRRLILSPPFTFLKFFVLKRYFLCGISGFIYAYLMMFYSFLTEAKKFRQD